MQISIVYDSGYGHAARQAHSVAASVRRGRCPDDTSIQSDLDTAAYLGQRVAETLRRLQPA